MTSAKQPFEMFLVVDLQHEPLRYAKLAGEGDSWTSGWQWTFDVAEALPMTRSRAQRVASAMSATFRKLEEPERVDFSHDGYLCIVRRDPEMGFYCGYVGIPKWHPFHGCTKGWLDGQLQCHGGVTYADTGHKKLRSLYAKDDDTTYYIGFDCAHALDLFPARDYLDKIDHPRVQYRTCEYVKAEVKRLAEQLRAVAQKEAN